MSDRTRALVAYGLRILSQTISQEISPLYLNPSIITPEIWSEYEQLLGTRDSPEPALSSIFSQVVPSGTAKESPTQELLYLCPHPLDLQTSLFPKKFSEVEADIKTQYSLDKLVIEYQELLRQYNEDDSALFEAFTNFFKKWAWSLPNTYGEKGVSLYHQWKTIAALVCASGKDWDTKPADEFSLIGGDFPGIQEFVYTITSKGAAKGLRGRSSYLQLLGDAIGRRLCLDLGLPTVNIIYAAGGNFLLLGPALTTQINGLTIEQRLIKIHDQLDGKLVDIFSGDISLCLAWTDLSATSIGNSEFSNLASKALKSLITAQKRTRFAGIAEKKWSILFAPQDLPGNRYCAICQRPIGRKESVELESQRDLLPQDRARRCPACQGFQELANQIGKPGSLILQIDSQSRKITRMERWQKTLWQITGLRYDINSPEQLTDAKGAFRYCINQTDFLAKGAHGFRFLANVTPHVISEDCQRPGDGAAEEEQPRLGSIRPLNLIAAAAQGVKQIGVLRMDVDNLGQVMISGLPKRSLAAINTLSDALDLFFSGWLNKICDQVQGPKESVEPKSHPDSLYIIYAGGDDLFITGAWDIFPELALRIHTDFTHYTCNHLTLSGGITLADPKAPLYQMAEQSGLAEYKAKHHTRGGKDKDSLYFLRLTFKWDEWEKIANYKGKIYPIIRNKKAPNSLLRILLDIYEQQVMQITHYHQQLLKDNQALPKEPDYQIYYGPWMWRSAYAMTRLAGSIKDDSTQDLVLELQKDCVDGYHIRYLGLTARWIELLTREEID